MFKIGDKVIDSYTNKIGTVYDIPIDITLKPYPISVNFQTDICTYTLKGRYNNNSEERYIKKVDDISGTVKIGPTHIYISFSHSKFLLPTTLTSFKVVNNMIIATYNGKEYEVYTNNIDQIIEQILNLTKKESL